MSNKYMKHLFCFDSDQKNSNKKSFYGPNLNGLLKTLLKN